MQSHGIPTLRMMGYNKVTNVNVCTKNKPNFILRELYFIFEVVGFQIFIKRVHVCKFYTDMFIKIRLDELFTVLVSRVNCDVHNGIFKN